MKIVSLLPYIAAALFAIPKTHPTTAIYNNHLKGQGAVIFDETVMWMEEWSGSPFMHSRNPDIVISVRYGKLEDLKLATAAVQITYCQITIREEFAPEHPLNPIYRDEDLTLIIMHEIAHCFGIMHNENDKSSIMYPASIPELQSTRASITRFFEMFNEHRGAE